LAALINYVVLVLALVIEKPSYGFSPERCACACLLSQQPHA
jgi:hypothetical protein